MPRNRRLLTLVVFALCLSLLAAGGLASVGDVAAQDGADNETDSPHEHPDETSEDGDTERVANWLQDRLSSSLGESTVHLEEGQYDQAREVVGDEYDDHLSQYAEISGEDDAEAYEETRDNQTALIDDVEEYENTYEEYEEAREAGNDERARELARDLDRLSESIDEESEAVQEQHEAIEEETGTDTSAARESVEETRSNIESTQQEVRDSEFVPTELTVETDSADASFADPMVIDGTITTTDGAPVTNEPITVEIGEQEVATTTDGSGSFSVEYRPTTEPLELTELKIGFAPETQSEYGGAETSVPVSIEATEPEVEITETTESVAFDEELTVGGSVEADGVGVGSVPVAVFIDGDRLGEVNTTDEGAFELTTTLPADVRAGEVEVRALVALNDQAIAGADTTTSTEVIETASSIDVAAEHSDDSIYVQGSLATAEGTPVGGEPVRLEFGEEAVTVETDEDGSYETLVGVPDGAGPTVTVESIYAEEGSNVGDASASADMRTGEGTLLTQIGEFLGIGWLDTSVPSLETHHWLALGGLVLLGGTGAYFAVGGRTRSSDDGTGATASSGGSTAGVPGSREPADLRATLLDSARERARAGDADRAVERAYVAVRQDESGQGRADTHWEFYRHHRENGFAAEQVDALRTLTERFERAAFSPLGVSDDDAHAAIEEAETVVGGR